MHARGEQQRLCCFGGACLPAGRLADAYCCMLAGMQQPASAKLPRTFSPESLPTTRMSSPTAAACGASEISLHSMNCNFRDSLKKPKSWIGSCHKGRTPISSRL